MPLEKFHVLVIDDNEDILFMLKAMLNFKGYTVSVKENTDDLENFITALSPSIIIMDMLLSGADGREICKQIKATPRLSSIPILMISAHPQAKEECFAAGANYFLAKPFEMNDIFETLSRALSQ